MNPDSALHQIIGQLEGTALPLADAIAHAREQATSVRAADAALRGARAVVRREAGAFDPALFVSLNHVEREEPTASFFAGAPVLDVRQTTGSAGMRIDLPIGTRLEAALNSVELHTNSSFAFLNPQYTTFGSLSIRQPLLGGFHVAARKELTEAERLRDAAQARYDQELLAIAAQVEERYWDLYAAERDFAVQKLTRDRGEAFLRETEVRARAGLIGPNQVANARTFLAQQEILLLDREEQLDRVSDQLASLIGTRPDAPGHRFITVDDPAENPPLEDADVLVRKALEGNLDLRAAGADVEARQALSRAALWEALPTVNLVGSLSGSGLSGTGRDVVFGSDTLRTTVAGDFGTAVGQAFRREYPAWSIGLEVNIPIGFRSGLGERERLDAEVSIAGQRYLEQKRFLEEQVRASYRELYHGQRRLQAAREGIAAAQEQVRIGLIEFQNGRSTAFELVRLSEDFALAQQRYSQALVRSAKAAAALKYLTSGGYTSRTSSK